MTTAADTAAERAFEASLAGRPVPPGIQGSGAVAAFTEAVRATATQPGRPNAALAELLANGLIVDQPSPSPRTVKRRRRRMWFFSAIIAKIAGASAVAQAATGAGIVLVGFTGAGAAGVLPEPVQHTFATVVSSVTPLTAPDPQQAAETVTPTDTTTPTATTTESTDATQAEATEAPENESEHPDNFGNKVSSAAHESGGVDGRDVSSWAHDRNDSRKAGDNEDSATVTTAPESTASATQTDSRHGGGDSRHGGDQGGDN